ncbi:hypothetical protein NQ314_019107 [Rhamnusium bicolor]|uniref:SLC26A/SulP transporter domain-containing protein n=1 Tax=Rhamnusium bicolor TaxID=1586634 RepID=A0AAV8WRJ5_9CUCU|nr:hypothetical protein NQ314_019107 [Rhamnusium bicolor]
MELFLFRSAHQETERDLQGEGGGGSCLTYDNPTLNVSATSINFRHRNDSSFMGSNDFIVIDNTKKRSTAVEAIKSVLPWLKRKAQSACTKKMLYRRLPILNWLPSYNSTCAVGDLVAGITVGLTVIPQALAYANIAGLPAEYGLYSSFLGCFVYIFLGSCKDVPMGPSAISALLTFQVVNGHGPEHAILLSFLSGLIQILMGFFGLGKQEH